ncbi:MAG: VWA domain-containing protein [Pirellulaceae bacterium]|nr:VWA domain-containing protein [Pirellulaceae bacterium]
MTFLQVGWLFGLVGLVVPIVLHLQRRRTKTMDWGAMRFLKQSLTYRRRGLTLEQLLLLLCRCLLLAAFVLAMARPWSADGRFLPGTGLMILLGAGILALVWGVVWNTDWQRRLTVAMAGLGMISVASGLAWFSDQSLLSGSESPRDVVLIIDGTDSMGLFSESEGMAAETTLFQQAIADAERFINKLPSQSTAAVLIADSRDIMETNRLQPNLNAVRQQLSELSFVGGKSDLTPAIERAKSLLKRGQNRQQEIILFTDNQSTNWQSLQENASHSEFQSAAADDSTNSGQTPIWGRIFNLPDYRHKLALTKLQIEPSPIRIGQQARLEVEIFNGGSQRSEATSLEILRDGISIEAIPIQPLEPGLRQTISLELPCKRLGTFTVTARVDAQDDVPADHVLSQEVIVHPPVSVLVVNGDTSSKLSRRGANFVRLALNGPVVTTESIDVGQLDTNFDLARFEVIILCDVPRLPKAMADSLGDYVSNGGGLMLLLGSRCEPEFYNAWHAGSEPLLPVKLEEPLIARETAIERELNNAKDVLLSPWTVDSTSLQHPALTSWIKTGEHDLTDWNTTRFWRVQQQNNVSANIAARLVSGDPLLIERHLGQGRVLIQTTAPDPRENNFINRVSFPVLMHLLTQYLADGDQQLPPSIGHSSTEADLTPAPANQILAIAEQVGINLLQDDDQLLQVAAGLPVGIEWWRYFAYAALILVAVESMLLLWVRCRRMESQTIAWRILLPLKSSALLLLPALWLAACLFWSYGWQIVGQATESQFVHNSRWPSWLVATLSCLIAWTYWDRMAFGQPWMPTFTKSVRLVLLGVLGFVLLEPIHSHDEETVEPRQVVVLWDRSESMLLPVAGSIGNQNAVNEKREQSNPDTNAPSRHDIAQQLLWDGFMGQSPLLNELEKNYGLQVYEFAATARAIEPDRSVRSDPSTSRWGQTTDLSAALQRVLADIPTGELSGVIVLTDGCDRSTVSPTATANPLAKQQIPIHSIIIGNQTSILDAEVAALQIPSQVYAGDEVTVRATIKADQLSGRTAKVNFFRDGDLLHSRPLQLPNNQVRTSVQFEDKPDQAGLHRYAVEIEPLDGEQILENNRREASVWVSNDRLRLLIVEQRPRWEFRYLKALFAGRDRNVSLQYVLLSPDRLAVVPDPYPMRASAARAFDDCEANLLPESEQEWLKFDVIVLGDVDPSELSEATQQTLLKFVRQRGGTFIVIAGQNAMPHRYFDSPLADLLPVQRSSGNAPPSSSGYRIRLTADGSRSSMLQTPFADVGEPNMWNSLPPLYWRHTAAVAKPGATVLAWADETALPNPPPAKDAISDTQKSQQNALMLWHRYGGGRVLQLNFDQTWRLRFWNGDEHHHRFWGRVMRWGTEDRLGMGTDLVRMGIDRTSYNTGDTMTVKVRLVDDQLNPIQNKATIATLFRDDQPISETLLEELVDSGGLLQTQLTLPEIPGRYRIEIGGPEVERLLTSENRPEKMVFAEFGVDGSLADSEANDIVASAAVAIPLAEQTGGLVLVPETASQLLERLGPRSRYHREQWSAPVWNTWPVVALFLLLIGSEWIARRWVGLI